jgi:hypothetical protein
VGCVGCVGVWGVWGSRPLLMFDIPQTALVATLDTYDLIIIKKTINQMTASYRNLSRNYVKLD